MGKPILTYFCGLHYVKQLKVSRPSHRAPLFPGVETSSDHAHYPNFSCGGGYLLRKCRSRRHGGKKISFTESGTRLDKEISSTSKEYFILYGTGGRPCLLRVLPVQDAKLRAPPHRRQRSQKRDQRAEWTAGGSPVRGSPGSGYVLVSKKMQSYLGLYTCSV